MDFSGFNFLEVIAAALSAFVVGGLWFGPLFGQRWQALSGVTEARIAASNMPLIYGLTLLLNLFVATMLSFFIEVAMMIGSGAFIGAAFGALLALIFTVPPFAINMLFSLRPLRLFLIEAGYMVVQFAVMGAILGAWT